MSLDVCLYLDIDVGGTEPHRVELFSANVTHNLNTMAEAAGIYEHLWRPGEVGVVLARDLIEPLQKGLTLLRSDSDRFEKLNPENGWGSYQHFVPWVAAYLEACEAFPKAHVEVWG